MYEVAQVAGQALVCPSCSVPNLSNRRYCGQCGTILVQDCSSCGFGNSSQEKYCGGCGQSIGQLPKTAQNKSSSATNLRTSPPPTPNLARRLADLNRSTVSTAREATVESNEDSQDMQQEQIDALFG